jgi:Mn-containing catalase
MANDFEFTQLLRAYRRRVISEASFEREVAAMGKGSEATTNGNITNASGFKTFGKIYGDEREAILEFLDKYGASEAAAELCLNKWVDLAKDDCVRGGIQMIAEREGYHGRVFARRLRELGSHRKDDGR